MPSSGPRPPAYAGPTCGTTAASIRCHSRSRWDTNTAASSWRLVVKSGRSDRASSSLVRFFASDNTCPNCRVGYQSSYLNSWTARTPRAFTCSHATFTCSHVSRYSRYFLIWAAGALSRGCPPHCFSRPGRTRESIRPPPSANVRFHSAVVRRFSSSMRSEVQVAQFADMLMALLGG
jgi:hypothetical protein